MGRAGGEPAVAEHVARRARPAARPRARAAAASDLHRRVRSTTPWSSAASRASRSRRSPGDVELSDQRLEPFWARAAELDAIVFLHPFGCTLDERLDRFYLSNTVGQPVENAVALSHLIFSGVLDRHPDLRLVAAHGGGYLPTFLGRSDHAWQVRPEAHGCRERPS